MSNQEKPQPAFAHAIEAEFASLLDYYGIAWEYEPTTFALQWDAAGRVIQAFSPDFYIPEQNRYFELTTSLPHLNNRKNRKVRRARELYPEVDIKLLNRADLRGLMLKYRFASEAAQLMSRNGAPEDS